MARMGRAVVSGVAQHITQRGNRRQQTFFHEGDYGAYLELMAEWRGASGVEVRLGPQAATPLQPLPGRCHFT